MKTYYVPVTGNRRLMFITALVGLGYDNLGEKNTSKIMRTLGEFDVIVVEESHKTFSGNFDLYSGQKPTPAEEVIADLVGPNRVKLNKEYTAIIHKDSKEVEVGCQRFPFSAVEELYKEITS